MPEKDKANIIDCLLAMKHIEEYLSGVLNIDMLLQDRKTYDAVLMNFIVIGEAANRISEEFKILNKHIDWRGMNDFRNFIAHDYFGISEDVVWSVIQMHLPILKTDLQKILEAFE